MLSPSIDTDSFYCRANGKLLITGEYFVLDGAEALAVPTKFGQSLRVKKLQGKNALLYWVALNSESKPWLQLTINTQNLSCIGLDGEEGERLTAILQQARLLNPAFLSDSSDYVVETQLEFPNNWGLGSSSTLIYCIAQWAHVNAFELLWKTLGGSGYDVACAGSNTPVLYSLKEEKPEIIKALWKPVFFSQIYFAHLGEKQSSPEGIKYYRQQHKDKSAVISGINHITEQILSCMQLEGFEALLNEHERLVGSFMGMLTVKQTHFSDYWGAVKSLGAWGGDFVLLTNSRSRDELKDYLHGCGIDTFFSWDELIVSNYN